MAGIGSKIPGAGTNIDRKTLSAIWSDWAKLPIMNNKEKFLHFFLLAFRAMTLSPLTTIATIITTGFSLFFFSIFLLVMQNISSTLLTVQEDVEVSIIMKDNVDSSIISKLTQEVEKYPGVSSVTKVTKNDALIFLRKVIGEDSKLLDGLDEKNPLPESIQVTFNKSTASEETYQRLVNDFKSSNYVDSVQFNSGALSQIGRLISLVHSTAWIGTIVMLTIAGLLIGNAVRLAIHVHRNEIEIMGLVGATKRYIQTPFLIEGVVEGFLGSIFGIILSYVLFKPFVSVLENGSIDEMLSSELRFLGVGSIMLVISAGIATGMISSWFATKQIQVR